MGSFSIWHWLIVLTIMLLPLIFVLRRPPAGPNRFGDLPPMMNFGEAIASFFRNYVNFSTRASRSEFWYCYLFYIGIMIILDIVDLTGMLSILWALGVLLPAIAVAARRLHDINRSGWHQLLHYFFPVGTIALFVWYCTRPNNAPATSPVVGHTTMASVEILERLAKLKESGAITAEEYQSEKRKILPIAR